MEQHEQLSSDLVVEAARLVRRIRRDSATTAAHRVLSAVDDLGPQGVSALAQADRCSQPTMTGLVNQLVSDGWARRDPHPTDARSTLVALTDAGAQELRRLRTSNAELIAGRLAHHPDLSLDDLATAVRVLQAVTDTQEGSA